MRTRRVSDMSSPAKRFRRRVLVMLENRDGALWALIVQTAEVKSHRACIRSIISAIREMR